jgi:hypothetical protein
MDFGRGLLEPLVEWLVMACSRRFSHSSYRVMAFSASLKTNQLLSLNREG